MARHTKHYWRRRLIGFLISLAAIGIWIVLNPDSYETVFVQDQTSSETDTSIDSLGVCVGAEDEKCEESNSPLATEVLAKIAIKGRAPKTNYSRDQFYDNWPNVNGCSLRQLIIKRELGDTAVLDGCNVISGSYTEPYTGQEKTFSERSEISSGIQIDHVVALSDAWQKGAQNISSNKRYELATDPLNLLAVDSSANQTKSDGDAATWLPPNKAFRCQYVARQVSVKYKYSLWMTQAEYDKISEILQTCPNEKAVGIEL